MHSSEEGIGRKDSFGGGKWGRCERVDGGDCRSAHDSKEQRGSEEDVCIYAAITLLHTNNSEGERCLESVCVGRDGRGQGCSTAVAWWTEETGGWLKV